MKNKIFLIFFNIIMTVLIPFSLFADEDEDEDYLGALEFGCWYSFWYPSSANLTTGKELDISVAPSLLKEVKFSMNFGEDKENHFAVDYVADKFFQNFEMEAQKRVGDEKTETMKQVMGLFRRQFGEYFIVEGMATFGSFKGKAGYKLDDDLSDLEIVQEMQKGETFLIDNRYFSTGDVFIWNTNFQIYDARLVLKIDQSCINTGSEDDPMGFGAGIKFMNYTAPINYNFKSDSSGSGISSYTLTSNFTGTFFSFSLVNWPGSSGMLSRYMEGWTQVFIGRGSLENDFMKTINVIGYGYDIGLKFLIPIVSGTLRGSIYFGARSVAQVFWGKEDTAFTSNMGSYSINESGKVDVIMSDIFFGPIAGVQISF